MTLNSSGTIGLAGTTVGQSAEIELGGNGTSYITMDDANVRTLAGVGAAGSMWWMSSLYGKSNQTKVYEPTSGYYYTAGGQYEWEIQYYAPGGTYWIGIYWGGANILNLFTNEAYILNTTSYTSGIYTYERGPIVSSNTGSGYFNQYNIRRYHLV